MQTYRHNWHVHIDPVGPTMDVAACSSMNTGGHYNPFSVDVAAMYMSVCNANRQLRCELGDSTGKTGTIDLNGMGFLRQDQYLPLFGMYSGKLHPLNVQLNSVIMNPTGIVNQFVATVVTVAVKCT